MLHRLLNRAEFKDLFSSSFWRGRGGEGRGGGVIFFLTIGDIDNMTA